MALFGALAVAALWLASWLSAKGFVWASEFSSVAGFILAVITLLAPLLLFAYRSLRGARPLSRTGQLRSPMSWRRRWAGSGLRRSGCGG